MFMQMLHLHEENEAAAEGSTSAVHGLDEEFLQEGLENYHRFVTLMAHKDTGQMLVLITVASNSIG